MRLPPQLDDVARLGAAIGKLAIALFLVPLAADWRSPNLASIRPLGLTVLVAVSLGLILWEWRFNRPGGDLTRTFRAATLAIASIVLALTVAAEARFQWVRHEVMTADPQELEKLGRHFIVGYRDPEMLRALVERRAIGGIFLAQHNVAGETRADVQRHVQALQDIRGRQGLPPLLVAADQEGGDVSHMSPPLTRPPAPSEIVAGHPDPADRREAIRTYAAAQARDLASIGVNLDFAPVVDVNHHLVNPNDRNTHIDRRAISEDPTVIRDAAAEYCAALASTDIRCTLKHFPGLGRVFGDTHNESATLDTPTAELAATDWVPFRSLMQAGAAFTMLSHARLTAIDAGHPTSISRAVVEDLLRGEWHYDGVLVTDDFSMAAIYRSKQGLRGSGVAALDAGVDLILVSYDPDLFFEVMYGLLQADRAGGLDQEKLKSSDRRLWLTRVVPR